MTKKQLITLIKESRSIEKGLRDKNKTFTDAMRENQIKSNDVRKSLYEKNNEIKHLKETMETLRKSHNNSMNKNRHTRRICLNAISRFLDDCEEDSKTQMEFGVLLGNILGTLNAP